MKLIGKVILFGGLLLSAVSCGTREAVINLEPTIAPTHTAEPTQIPPTTAPTNTPTPVPTDTVPPPTLTSIPTVAPTEEPTETPIPPTVTPFPTETAVPPTETPVAAVYNPDRAGDHGGSNCRTLEQLAGVRQNISVKPYPWPRPNPVGFEIYTGNPANKIIHLGFDVEGSPERLNEILDVLDRRNVKTTMFILGSWAELYPDSVKQFVDRGHELANHTYSHSDMGKMSAEEVIGELEKTEQIVQSLTGQTTKPLMRPPFGSRSSVSLEAARSVGWTTFIWSGSTEDWKRDFSADDMCDSMMLGAFAGSILYTHTWREEMPEVVDRFIGELQAQGYTFVPLSVIIMDDPASQLVGQ